MTVLKTLQETPDAIVINGDITVKRDFVQLPGDSGSWRWRLTAPGDVAVSTPYATREEAEAGWKQCWGEALAIAVPDQKP